MSSKQRSKMVEGYTANSTSLSGQRIVYCIGAYNHIVDGSSLALNRLVGHILACGADARIFAPTIDNPPLKHVGTLIPVRSFRFPGYLDYYVSTGLTRAGRAELESFAPTMVHVATPDVTGLQLLRFTKKRHIPLVASYHTHFPSYLEYYWLPFTTDMLWKYLRWFYGQCEHLYVPTESMAEELRSKGISRGLRLWQRGIDAVCFNPTHRSTAWRRSLGIDDDEVVITFVSRLVWEKGLKVYAGVIEELNRRGITHRSLIVGDGPAREELAGRLHDTIFTGQLGGDALSRAFASSDIFLFPSATETFGNVTLEAMASGLPTVCADATGSRSVVEDGHTGFLVSPDNSEGFLEAVENLLRDDTLRYEMGQRALDRSRRFEWTNELNRVVGYYEEILFPKPMVHSEIM